MILDQAKLDDGVCGLLEKVSEVYTFMKEDGRLAEIPSMEVLFRRLARQTLECSDFIVHYSEIESACKWISPHHHPEFSCRLVAQGKEWASTFWTKRMARFRVSAKFLTVSCSNFEIERLVRLL